MVPAVPARQQGDVELGDTHGWPRMAVKSGQVEIGSRGSDTAVWQDAEELRRRVGEGGAEGGFGHVVTGPRRLVVVWVVTMTTRDGHYVVVLVVGPGDRRRAW